MISNEHQKILSFENVHYLVMKIQLLALKIMSHFNMFGYWILERFFILNTGAYSNDHECLIWKYKSEGVYLLGFVGGPWNIWVPSTLVKIIWLWFYCSFHLALLFFVLYNLIDFYVGSLILDLLV
jgi:hypothetical protein